MLRFLLSFFLLVRCFDEFLHFVDIIIIDFCLLLLSFFLPCECDEVFRAIDAGFLDVCH